MNTHSDEVSPIIRRRRAEADRVRTEEQKAEIWRWAAAEIRFKSFEIFWRKEVRRNYEGDL